MKKTFCVLSGLLLASALGCQKSGGGSSAPAAVTTTATPTPSPAPGVSSNFLKTYEFREFGGCTTGFHQLNSQQDYCSALLNESLNNNCALQMRQSAYATECSSGTGGTIGSGVSNQTLVVTGSAAYCFMSAEDPSATGLFDNRQASNQRFISWDGKRAERFNISALLPAKYGKVHLNLIPAQGTQAATGEIVVSQDNGRLKYSESSQFNSRMVFLIGETQSQKKVSIDCLPDASFVKNTANLSHMVCQVNNDRPVDISWSGKSRLTTSLKARDVGSLAVSLYPAQGQTEAQIEISASAVDSNRNILGRAAARSGLAIKHASLQGTQVQVRCFAASR